MADLTLAIRLTGDGSDLRAEIVGTGDSLDRLKRAEDSAGTSARKLERDTNQLGQRLGTLISFTARAATALTGLATGAVAANAKEMVAWGDNIAKVRTRIGASAEALSEYEHVARSTGVEIGQLTTAWQRQTRRIAEAAQGSGEAKDALRELGLSAEYLKGLKPEDQFEAIADAMADIEDPADRVRLAMRLWDTEGVALLQTIEGGSAALREMRQAARDAGLSLSGETAQQMADAQQAFDSMQTAVRGVRLELAKEFLPEITAATEYLRDEAIPEWRKFLEIVGVLQQSTSKPLFQLQADLDDVVGKIRSVEAQLAEARRLAEAETMASARAARDQLVGDLESRLSALRGQAERLRAAIEPKAAEFASAKTPEGRRAAEVARQQAEEERQRQRLIFEEGEAMRLAAKEADKARTAAAKEAARVAEVQAEQAAAALEKLRADAEGIMAALSPNAELAGYFEALEKLEEAQRAGIITTDQLAAAAERLAEEYELLNDGVDEMAPSMMALAEASEKTAKELKENDRLARDLGLTFSSAFEDALVKGESLRDVIRGLGQDIARIVIRRNITEPLSDAVGGLFGGGESGGGGFLGGLTDLIFGQQFHAGGEVGRDGSPRLVDPRVFAGAPRMHRGGLAGDEVPAILQRGERVLPRGESGGAVMVNYAPVINAIDTQTGLAFLGQHRDVIVGLVNDAYNRRGVRGPVR